MNLDANSRGTFLSSEVFRISTTDGIILTALSFGHDTLAASKETTHCGINTRLSGTFGSGHKSAFWVLIVS